MSAISYAHGCAPTLAVGAVAAMLLRFTLVNEGGDAGVHDHMVLAARVLLRYEEALGSRSFVLCVPTPTDTALAKWLGVQLPLPPGRGIQHVTEGIALLGGDLETPVITI